MNLETLVQQVDKLLQVSRSGSTELTQATQVYHGALTVISAVHGPQSHQVSSLNAMAKRAFELSGATAVGQFMRCMKGALENLKSELEGGLTGSLQKRIAGEVLSDLLQLARAVLDTPGENAKNVGAVLAASAFEDTIRRMGVTFAGLMGTDDLVDVLEALKNKGILVSPQLGIAQSFLNFRNRALHANWDQIDRAAVNSVLGFVQELLLKHFH